MRTQLEQLRDRVDALETEVDTLHDEIDQLEDRVDHLQQENATLRGQLPDLDDIDERVTALESRPHLDWDTKEFDDATIVRPEKANYPIGRALTTRPQWDEVESEIDNILEMLDAGEQTDHQNGARLRVAPETPLEELCACPDIIQQQATEKVDIYRAVKFAEELYSRSSQTSYDDKRMVRASDLSRWLATHTDCQTNATGDRAHGQTITRVIHIYPGQVCRLD